MEIIIYKQKKHYRSSGFRRLNWNQSTRYIREKSTG